MTSITSKELHEQTGALLDQVKRGQRFRVLRGGETDAILVPATDQIDPTWDEIMADVRKARAQGKPLHPNPILAERRKRKYATRVRR
jgi:antitoxin (DNA-binding transcriptional repressor) of toxin-antitoxin stability system